MKENPRQHRPHAGQEALMRRDEPMFPILNDPIVKAIPWAAISAHEPRAIKNHSQSLSRLAARGGLSVIEVVLVMRDKDLHFNKVSAAAMYDYRAALMADLKKFETARAVAETLKDQSGKKEPS